MTMIILDFRPVAVAATSATVVGAVLIFAAIMTDLSAKQTAEYDQPTFLSLSLAFGTIAFSFGRMSTFPTTQNDMQYPQKFPRSVALAYLGKFHFILNLASIFSPRKIEIYCLGSESNHSSFCREPYSVRSGNIV